MVEVTFDAELGRELLMLGILSSLVQREGLSAVFRKSFKALDARLILLHSPFLRDLGDQNEPALSLVQGIQGHLAFSGDETS